MTSILFRPLQPPPVPQKRSCPSGLRIFLSTWSNDLFVWALLLIYLLPIVFMVVLAFKSDAQLEDRHAPWYPARKATYEYQGHIFDIYHVPTQAGMRRLALAIPGDTMSQFIDPQDPQARVIEWNGDWTSLEPYYEVSLAWSNFEYLFSNFPFPKMIEDTLALVLIGEIGVLLSSILIAYGFARYPLPGGDLLFYVMITTILIPEKVTLIPTFYIYVQFFH